mmetsp:Transcript_46798/g.111312  ORF Transcript_46798/g.111312 Transcript_46798/m.111312 type:complete len:632 (+) Transcript_46798:111-2006(+)
MAAKPQEFEVGEYIEEGSGHLCRKGSQILATRWKVAYLPDQTDAPDGILQFPRRPGSGAPMLVTEPILEQLLRCPSAADPEAEKCVAKHDLAAAAPDVPHLTLRQLLRLHAALPVLETGSPRELIRFCDHVDRSLRVALAKEAMTKGECNSLFSGHGLALGGAMLTALGLTSVFAESMPCDATWELSLPQLCGSASLAFFQASDIAIQASCTSSQWFRMLASTQEGCWKVVAVRSGADISSALGDSQAALPGASFADCDKENSLLNGTVLLSVGKTSPVRKRSHMRSRSDSALFKDMELSQSFTCGSPSKSFASEGLADMDLEQDLDASGLQEMRTALLTVRRQNRELCDQLRAMRASPLQSADAGAKAADVAATAASCRQFALCVKLCKAAVTSTSTAADGAAHGILESICADDVDDLRAIASMKDCSHPPLRAAMAKQLSACRPGLSAIEEEGSLGALSEHKRSQAGEESKTPVQERRDLCQLIDSLLHERDVAGLASTHVEDQPAVVQATTALSLSEAEVHRIAAELEEATSLQKATEVECWRERAELAALEAEHRRKTAVILREEMQKAERKAYWRAVDSEIGELRCEESRLREKAQQLAAVAAEEMSACSLLPSELSTMTQLHITA